MNKSISGSVMIFFGIIGFGIVFFSMGVLLDSEFSLQNVINMFIGFSMIIIACIHFEMNKPHELSKR